MVFIPCLSIFDRIRLDGGRSDTAIEVLRRDDKKETKSWLSILNLSSQHLV